jgi:hypothetical protein
MDRLATRRPLLGIKKVRFAITTARKMKVVQRESESWT